MSNESLTDLCSMKDALLKINMLERRLRSQFQVTLNESLCLCCVSLFDLTAGDLARELGLSTSRISRVLNSLEQKKLIVRSFAEEDRRAVRLEITQHGNTVLEELKNAGFTFPAILNGKGKKSVAAKGGIHG